MIENSEFSDLGGKQGGVISLGGSVQATITNSVFKRNKADISGGVVLGEGSLSIMI